MSDSRNQRGKTPAFGGGIARGLLVVLLTAAMLALAGIQTVAALAQEAPANPAGADEEVSLLDCSDIATQRGAQALFLQAQLSAKEDRFELDRDGDGVACETVPGGTAEDGTRLGAKTGGDLDCMDFSSQKAAQDRLREDPSDPYKLDPESNGVACDIRPADYRNHDSDFAPVTQARSGTDLDCGDFEFQQEAQMVYFQDESDPNHLDKGENGSAVCENLPILASNAESVRVASAGTHTPHPTAVAEPSTPLALIEAWPRGGGLGLLLDLGALLLVASGILALLTARRRNHPRGSA